MIALMICIAPLIALMVWPFIPKRKPAQVKKYEHVLTIEAAGKSAVDKFYHKALISKSESEAPVKVVYDGLTYRFSHIRESRVNTLTEYWYHCYENQWYFKLVLSKSV